MSHDSIHARLTTLAALVAATALFTATAPADIMISEIMYNPASSEKTPIQTEWVELYNDADEAVELTGWYLADEDGQTEPLPQGIRIEPGQTLVLIPGEQSIAEFQEAWGDGFPILPVQGWNGSKNQGMGGLANSPSQTNEILTLRQSDGTVIDLVNFDDTKPWPSDGKGGASIYLAPEHLSSTANDQGENWRKSKPEQDGARTSQETQDFNQTEVGSPGTVQTPA